MVASVIFYMFATVLLVSGALAVSVKNPVHAVLFLILCFFNASGLFLLMGAEFLAFIILIVYVGAVAVLFLFVVMMLDIKIRDKKQGDRRTFPIIGAVIFVLVAQMVAMAGAWTTVPEAIKAVGGEEGLENTRALGQVLYTDYAYPFEVSGLVLLVAMVGAIVLTMRDRRDVRRQNAGSQIGVSASDVVEVKKVISKQGVEL